VNVVPIPQEQLRSHQFRARKSSPKGTKIEKVEIHTAQGTAFFLKRELTRVNVRTGVEMTRPVYWDRQQNRWVG